MRVLVAKVMTKMIINAMSLVCTIEKDVRVILLYFRLFMYLMINEYIFLF